MKCWLAAICVLIIGGVAHAADRKPNIVLIVADGLGYADVSFDGRREWSTPNVHRLALEGTVFRRFYSAFTEDLPAYAAIMSGRYGIHTGVTSNASFDLPARQMTIAQALKPHGYVTGIFGRWRYGATPGGEPAFVNPLDRGFDEFFGPAAAEDVADKFPARVWDARTLKQSDGYGDDLCTDRAISFMKQHKDEQFFLYLPLACPNGKPAAPKDEMAALDGKFQEIDDDHPRNTAYAAEVVRMDKEVGRILKTLDDLQLDKQTLVVFTSTRGASFGRAEEFTTVYFDSNRPFRGGAGTLWEGGIRVPAVVCWPGHLPRHQDSHEIVQSCDLFPTLLAVAGVQPDPNWKLDGANMLEVFRGQAPSPDRTLFWAHPESGAVQFAAMHDDLKLVATGTNQPELFNVELDPVERHNIAAEFPHELQSMKQALDQWVASGSQVTQAKPAATQASR